MAGWKRLPRMIENMLERLESVDTVMQQQFWPGSAEDELEQIGTQPRNSYCGEQEQAFHRKLPVSLSVPCKQRETSDKIPFRLPGFGDGFPGCMPGAGVKLMKKQRQRLVEQKKRDGAEQQDCRKEQVLFLISFINHVALRFASMTCCSVMQTRCGMPSGNACESLLISLAAHAVRCIIAIKGKHFCMSLNADISGLSSDMLLMRMGVVYFTVCVEMTYVFFSLGWEKVYIYLFLKEEFFVCICFACGAFVYKNYIL